VLQIASAGRSITLLLSYIGFRYHRFKLIHNFAKHLPNFQLSTDLNLGLRTLISIFFSGYRHSRTSFPHSSPRLPPPPSKGKAHPLIM